MTSRYIASGERAVNLSKAFAALGSRSRDDPDARFERREAEVAARMAAMVERRALREKVRVRKAAEDLEAAVKALVAEAKAMASDAMRATGHHQVRWAWRRKRGVNMSEIQSAVAELARKYIPADATPPTPEARAKFEAEFAFSQTPAGVAATVDRWEAQDAARPAGSPSAVESARKAFRCDPASEVVEQLLEQWSDREISRELIRHQMAQMRADLEGPSPSAIERHLVERAMTCWLDTLVSDRLAIGLERSVNFTPAELDHFQKSRDRAHRRYIDVLKSLALVRQRALPAMKLALIVRDGATGSMAAATVETAGPSSPGLESQGESPRASVERESPGELADDSGRKALE